ncbi:MAG: potassium transporter [Bacteroidetes bacterium HGW-Bacteroidetes-4]|jgi:trk system potassium uptake protein TrkH|nr:MAG: potassium transporter [Bacteroidetes bacterium HGW-Bacteroidetes-4]
MKNIVNLKIVFKVISRNLFILAASLMLCVGVALYYSESFLPFVWAASISFLLGVILFRFTHNQPNNNTISKKDAYLTVTLSWLFLALIGSLPYLFSQTIPSVVDALFESMSGFTTTGSSILTDIEALPQSILFWRSLTHWIGGIGIIVLVIVVMPTLQIGGYHLFTLESSLQEKIQPRIKSVGNRLLFIYVALTISEVIFLLLGHMSFFDSVCHAFGTVATGGFSPKNTSIAAYSPYIQYVIMLFMLLAGTNFVIHYYMLKRQFAKARKNEELKIYYVIVFSLGIIIAAALYFIMGKPLEESFRESFFQVISIITCTGFASADYLLWPTFAWVLIFLAMFLGGSTGSTAGGIKMARHLLLFKNIRRVFYQMMHPKAILPIRLNNNTLSEELNSSILTFVSLYLIIFIVGSLIMLALGLDAKTAASSVATCMAGIGPGIGSVGPTGNFAHLPEIAKLLLTFLMLVGRLELYTVIMLFTRTFWSK